MDNEKMMKSAKTAARAKAKVAAHETRSVLDEVGGRVNDQVDTAGRRLGGWLMNFGDRLGGTRYYYRRPATAGRMVGFLTGGAVLGAALMYLLDPNGGRRRRALLRDQATHFAHEMGDAAETTARDVRNRSQGLAANPRGMFGRRSSNGGRPGVMQRNWSPTTRLFAGVLGGALAVLGITRRDPLGYALGAIGVGLAARAATNMPVTKLVGVRKQEGIDVHKTINVQAPVDEVYAYWRNFENFPHFMSHLKEVQQTSGGESRWVASGPAGVPVEWKAYIVEERPQEAIAWQSTPDSAVQNSGRVHFAPNAHGGTQIDVHMSYNPPAGAVGHSVASLFGSNPKQAMDEDLQRFKSLIEEGRTITSEGTEYTRGALE